MRKLILLLLIFISMTSCYRGGNPEVRKTTNIPFSVYDGIHRTMSDSNAVSNSPGYLLYQDVTDSKFEQVYYLYNKDSEQIDYVFHTYPDDNGSLLIPGPVAGIISVLIGLLSIVIALYLDVR